MISRLSTEWVTVRLGAVASGDGVAEHHGRAELERACVELADDLLDARQELERLQAGIRELFQGRRR